MDVGSSGGGGGSSGSTARAPAAPLEDGAQLLAGASTPPDTPPAAVLKERLVSEITDRLFYRAKLRVSCPPRWRVLFLSAAKLLEKKFDRMREEMFVAANLDDMEAFRRLHKEVPTILWNWWAYDLDIVARASARFRDEQLALLPALAGQAFPGQERVARARAAREARPFIGSSEAMLEAQRGDILLEPIRQAFDKGTHIEVAEIEAVLAHILCGRWQGTITPAIGVNHSAKSGQYAGWTALHFLAASPRAGETGVEAARTVLDAKADPLLADGSGCTSLQVAAANNNLPMVEILLERGGPLEVADLAGCTSLITAARGRHAHVVRRIAEWAMPLDEAVPMMTCEAENNMKRFNVQRGVQLHKEVANGDRLKVKHLVLVGDGQGGDLANVNFADSLGRRPLHVAARATSNDHRSAELLRCLAALKADLDARDLDGETALHAAAQLKRGLVVRTLLRLKAHPGLHDNRGRTPLMLAAIPPKGVREAPLYEGRPVNRAFPWQLVEDLLIWDGKDDPPGPAPRRVLEKPKTLREEAEERQREMEDAKKGITRDNENTYLTPAMVTKARAEAVAALGFDDQWIISEDGKVNRGDRIQLAKALLKSSSKDLPGCDKSNPGLSSRRMRQLWDALTGPLLGLEIQGLLSPRLSDLLQYILMCVLGPGGMAFGWLVGSCIGTRDAVLPVWDDFQNALESNGDIASRIAAIRTLGFRGPLPRRTYWVGSVWARDDYPREPSLAPWGALHYVEQDTAKRLNEGAIQIVRLYSLVSVIREFTSDNDDPVVLKKGSRGRVREIDSDGDALIKFDDHDTGQLVFQENFENLQVEAVYQDEAFKNNSMPAFDVLEGSMALPTGSRPRPFRSEQLQLANRLFVNEPLGMRLMAEERVRVAGELLLCPLLLEAAEGLDASGVELEEVLARRQMLRYVAAQMQDPDVQEPEPQSVKAWLKMRLRADARRAPYLKEWRKHRVLVAWRLVQPIAAGLGDLTPAADVDLLPGGAMKRSANTIPEQSSVLPADMVAWLQSRFSTKAFIELRHCGAVDTADDFCEVVVGVAARSPKYFTEHFWRATFYLMLWGRANHLHPFFLKELRRRLPDGTLLQGPTIRPRSDFLLEMERKVIWDAQAKRREDAHWMAWEESESKRRQAVGKLGPEAKAILAASKIIDARLTRHMRTWGNIDYRKGPRKPNTGDDGLASGGGASAARMLSDAEKPPKAVDWSLGESKAATGADGLPSGLTDVLRASVMCDTEAAFREAFAALIAPPPPPPKAVPGQGADEDGRSFVVTLRVLRIINDFHEEQRGAVLPRAARVLLLGRLAVRPKGIGTVSVDQLVEIELLLPTTSEARWLAESMELDPAETSHPDFFEILRKRA